MSTDTSTVVPAAAKEPSKNEGIKEASHYLRGTILAGLADASTGAIGEDDSQLLKFHGTYLQDDRDLRNERRKQKLEKAFIFMVRVRVPGGVCSPQQWLEVDRIAGQYANGTIKLTTRQAFQLHGILKANLKSTIKEINEALLDTLAACGDVNRNVMCNPNPHLSSIHAEVLDYARQLTKHLSPRTPAYHEIWLDKERVAGGDTGGGEDDTNDLVEPIYGKHYLPRKFKIAIAVPPSNDIDIFANDLGFIAIVENGKLAGFNVTVGGGMGMSHNNKATYPRLADVLNFCTPAQMVDVAEKIVTIQRDFGDRSDRKHARFKYTIQDRGLDWFRTELETRLGYKLSPARPYTFTDNGDRYGWADGVDGKQHLTLFIEGGRLHGKQRDGLREIAKIHTGDFRLTGNQNLIIGSIAPSEKPKIEALLKQYGLDQTATSFTGLRRGGLACVALPTCGLALAESERNLPNLVDELDKVIRAAGLAEQSIHIRSSGCPNGCARPYLGEIGLVGKVPGKYNLYLGAAHNGSRMNKIYKEAIPNEQIVAELTPIINRYAAERTPNETFGDFVIRAGYVTAVTSGAVDFHN
ncbi:MAG TPA: NADPH-dependent assimilatory sulfite reductase hemoprotein subunit [Opitutales bacterium]|jgi:sulfite reductase (NADPH) hemoprotein beta-component|nr:NADPH-dependent assimilatory sulfite reductase hemoprotein subunit [Opitutales bacterium]